MQGFPPAADKRVTKQNAFELPNLRWALRNARAMTPTTGIRRAPSPLALPVGEPAALDQLRFTIGEQSLSLPEYLRATFTDGFIVLHRGKLVYERYLDSFAPEQAHIWASMTKSVTGLLAASLIAEGKLSPASKLSSYVPELAGTPFGEATLQQNLDMQVEAVYPAKVPPDIGLFAAAGIVPRQPDMPDNIYSFLQAATLPEQASATPIWYYQNGSPESGGLGHPPGYRPELVGAGVGAHLVAVCRGRCLQPGRCPGYRDGQWRHEQHPARCRALCRSHSPGLEQTHCQLVI